MDIGESNTGQIILYKAKGNVTVDVKLCKETVWLTQSQIATLFDVNVPAISKHIKNIFIEGELSKKPTVSKMEIVQTEGSRTVNRKIDFYNLDMIVSVGYRVNSKSATQFRIWATTILKDYLVKGFTINQKRLQEKGFDEFQQAVALIKNTVESKRLSGDEKEGLLKVITEYAQSWALLQKYDENSLEKPKAKKAAEYVLTYEIARKAIDELKKKLRRKKQASDIFGNERSEALKGILGNLYQTFGEKELYTGIGEKAAHLLYFVIKDHPFTDGNKRSAALLFILFLSRNRYLLKTSGELKINDNALIAIALLIAESSPKQKDTMIKLVMNLIAAS